MCRHTWLEQLGNLYETQLHNLHFQRCSIQILRKYSIGHSAKCTCTNVMLCNNNEGPNQISELPRVAAVLDAFLPLTHYKRKLVDTFIVSFCHLQMILGSFPRLPPKHVHSYWVSALDFISFQTIYTVLFDRVQLSSHMLNSPQLKKHIVSIFASILHALVWH